METVKSVSSLKKFICSTENSHCQSCHMGNRGQKGWRVPEGPIGEDTTSYFLHVNPRGKAQIINSLCAHVSWWGKGAMPEVQFFWVRTLSNLSLTLQLPRASVVNEEREVRNAEDDGEEENVGGEGRRGTGGGESANYRTDAATQCLNE